jgi:RNA polymerase sigma-70 factor (ECF subfamily)
MMDRRSAGHVDDVALAVHIPAPAADAALAGPLTFERVYEDHFDFVWRSVRRLGVDERSLDDAAQDVFIVVHRKLGELQKRESIKSWLFGIARRVAHDHRRRSLRKDRGTVSPEGIEDSRPSPRDDVARSEAVGLLRSFLDSLDDDKREAFILAELEQMTVPEIADAVGANINTIYSRLRAARKAFEQAVSRMRARDDRVRSVDEMEKDHD